MLRGTQGEDCREDSKNHRSGDEACTMARLSLDDRLGNGWTMAESGRR
jgi:hypothetical protein